MDEIIMDEAEKQQFKDFKHKLNLQAAEGQVAKIEYNLLDAAVEKGTLRRACQDAELLKLGAVCVLPCFVKQCVAFLGQSPHAKLISCVSFPHGGECTKTKVYAVKHSFKDGADEVEVAAPLAFIKDENWSYVKRELKKLKKAGKNKVVRINLESPLLTREELTRLCTLCTECKITCIRISSGAYSYGFDADILSAVTAAVKDKCIVKADGISNISEMNTAVDMGAGIIGSRNAADLARIVLQTADF